VPPGVRESLSSGPAAVLAEVVRGAPFDEGDPEVADITNAQAVAFANEECRVICDLLGKFLRCGDKWMQDVVVKWEDVTGDHVDGDLIVDGSAQDGRNPRTKFNVGQLKWVVEQVLAACRVDDREDIVNAWAVNTVPPF
jgi:hypothetical protein